MWWQILLGIATGTVIGTSLFVLGFSMGYKWGKEEDSYQKYIEAMTDDG